MNTHNILLRMIQTYSQLSLAISTLCWLKFQQNNLETFGLYDANRWENSYSRFLY